MYTRPLCLSLTLLISLKTVIGCVRWAVCVRDSKWKWGFVSDSGDSKQMETNGRCLLLSSKRSHPLTLCWQHTHICLPAALFIFLELSVWEILVITQQPIAIHTTLVYLAVCFVDPQPVSVLRIALCWLLYEQFDSQSKSHFRDGWYEDWICSTMIISIFLSLLEEEEHASRGIVGFRLVAVAALRMSQCSLCCFAAHWIPPNKVFKAVFLLFNVCCLLLRLMLLWISFLDFCVCGLSRLLQVPSLPCRCASWLSSSSAGCEVKVMVTD